MYNCIQLYISCQYFSCDLTENIMASAVRQKKKTDPPASCCRTAPASGGKMICLIKHGYIPYPVYLIYRRALSTSSIPQPCLLHASPRSAADQRIRRFICSLEYSGYFWRHSAAALQPPGAWTWRCHFLRYRRPCSPAPSAGTRRCRT